MIRHTTTFIVAAAIGALVALALRSVWYQPYAVPAPAPAPAQEPAAEATQQRPSTPPAKPTADPHAGHVSVPVSVRGPVNTICAICGMKPDPKLTATYLEQLIAFGCKSCPEKFRTDPDRYGPYFLRSEEAP